MNKFARLFEYSDGQILVRSMSCKKELMFEFTSSVGAESKGKMRVCRLYYALEDGNSKDNVRGFLYDLDAEKAAMFFPSVQLEKP